MQTGWFPLLVAGVFGTGCTASMLIGGGTLTDHDHAPSSKAQYTSATCTNLSTGASSKGTNDTYYVVEEQGQPAFFERSRKGSGTLITNRWTAADGEHYFTWVHHSGARTGDGAITALFRSPYETGLGVRRSRERSGRAPHLRRLQDLQGRRRDHQAHVVGRPQMRDDARQLRRIRLRGLAAGSALFARGGERHGMTISRPDHAVIETATAL